MSYYGSWAINDLLTFTVNTHNASTGAASDADGVPTYRVYEDETATPILTGSMALLDTVNTTGFYSEQLTLSAVNGFEKGKSYNIYISAAVSSITGTISHNFQIEAEVDANTVSDKTGYSADVTSISGDSVAADNLEADYDGTGYTKTNSTVGTVTTLTGHTAQTGDSFARLGAPAGASIAADLLTIDNLVDDLETRLTAARAGYLDNLNGHIAQTGDNFARLGAPAGASVSADIAGIQSDTDDIQTRLPAALTTGTADSGSTTTMVDAALTQADTDYWKGNIIRFTSGNISGQSALITAFAPVSNTVTFYPAVTQIVTTQNYEILPYAPTDIYSISGDNTSADNLELDYDGTGYAKANSTVGTVTNVTNQVSADVTAISGDSVAADNVEADYDGTGYAKANSTIGTTTTNTDMRGTDNAALASVLGALTDAAAAGDPTATDTVMQYIKQLINILIGTTGITTFPAEAAPANNVSLAEIIRAIHTDVTGLNGAAMRGTDSAALASVLGTPAGADIATDIASVQTDTTAILVDTNSLNDGAIAEITSITDTPATPTLQQAVMLLYMWLRNNTQATATERRILNNAGTEVLDATMSDDGTTFQQGILTNP